MDIAAALQERIKGAFPDLLGIRFVEASQEGLKAELEAREELRTVQGITHGGALMAFADTLGAVATVLNLPPGCTTTTLESKTNFFAPIKTGGKAIGICTPLHRGKRTMVWQTRIEDESGKLAALVTQTQIVLEPR